jgi:hypothetical protein
MESLGLRSGIKEATKPASKYKILEIKEHREASKVMGGWELLVRFHGMEEDTWEPIKTLKINERKKVQVYMKAHHSDFNVPVVPLRRQPTRSRTRGTTSKVMEKSGSAEGKQSADDFSAESAATSSTATRESEDGAEGHDTSVVPLVRQQTRSRNRETGSKMTEKPGGTDGKQSTEEIDAESAGMVAAMSSTASIRESEDCKGHDVAVDPLVSQPTRSRTRDTASKGNEKQGGTEGKQSTVEIGTESSAARVAAMSSTASIRESEDCEGHDVATKKASVEASVNMDDDSDATTENETSSGPSSRAVFTSSQVKESKHCEEGGEVVTKPVDAGETEEEVTKTIDGKVDSTAPSKQEATQKTEQHAGGEATKEYNNSQYCHHDICANYREETNAQYCRSGSKYYLADVQCAICHDMFTSTGKSKRGEYFKPSFSKPLFACINSVAGCQHAICYYCFQQKLLSSDN